MKIQLKKDEKPPTPKPHEVQLWLLKESRLDVVDGAIMPIYKFELIADRETEILLRDGGALQSDGSVRALLLYGNAQDDNLPGR